MIALRDAVNLENIFGIISQGRAVESVMRYNLKYV